MLDDILVSGAEMLEKAGFKDIEAMKAPGLAFTKWAPPEWDVIPTSVGNACNQNKTHRSRIWHSDPSEVQDRINQLVRHQPGQQSSKH